MTFTVPHLIRYVLCLGLFYSGLVMLARFARRAFKRQRVLVLAYHSLSGDMAYLDMAIPPDLFLKQVKYLKKVFGVHTLSGLLARFGKEAPPSGDLAAVTVDDGYADNCSPLMRALAECGVPSTVYLVTDCIDEGQPTTTMWAMLAIHHAVAEVIDLPELGLGPLRIRTAEEKVAAIRAIDDSLKPLSAARRVALVDYLLERSGAEAQIRELGASAMLGWDQVGRMHEAGIEFGGHSLTHTVLSGLSVDAVRNEIVGSMERIRARLGAACKTFAYPYGSPAEVSDAVVEICRTSGASAAVMLVEGEAQGADRFRIPRMMVTGDRSTNPWGHYSRAMWACELEGILDAPRRLVGLFKGPEPWGAGQSSAPMLPDGVRNGGDQLAARPEKIMFLVDHFEPGGGTEGQLLQLLQYLDRSKFEPAVTLLRRSAYMESHPPVSDVRVLDVPKLLSVRAVGKMVRFALGLRRRNYRLVHCYFNDSSIIAPVILRMLGIHVIVSRRDMGFWYTPGNLPVLRMVAPFVDLYVANSHAVKQVVHDEERVPEGRIAVIYNGYVSPSDEVGDGAQSLPAGLEAVPGGSPIVGLVANLRPIKRIDILVEAFAKASGHSPGARLVIVGDTSSSQAQDTYRALQELVAQHAIKDKVVFVGKVGQPGIYIKRFSVAVLCSESEGFSNSIIEYMQAARPIICTDAGGNPELIRDGENGFLVPVGDADALAERLTLLLTDQALASRLGRAAFQSAQALTHTRMVAAQMACYNRVLDRAGND